LVSCVLLDRHVIRSARHSFLSQEARQEHVCVGQVQLAYSHIRKQRFDFGGTADLGYLHWAPSGGGDFVNVAHKGIECGLMAAYAEGFGFFAPPQHYRDPG
jgi:6-phosphogluconate dehydrogenase (decarboxylating)